MLNIIGIVLAVCLVLIAIWLACRWCYHTGYVNGFSAATRKYLDESQKQTKNFGGHGKWKRSRRRRNFKPKADRKESDNGQQG